MLVFLDDERPTPNGWTRAFWPEEAIALLEFGPVREISLDHDLGDDQHGTGYDVIVWIEEAVVVSGYLPPRIGVHSANPAARARMEAGIGAIERLSAPVRDRVRPDGTLPQPPRKTPRQADAPAPTGLSAGVARAMDVGRARAFAIAAHAGQLYGDRPYLSHLDAVAESVSRFGRIAQVVAYLHDIVEDTDATLVSVRELFGDLVADCVDLVTDSPEMSRRERKAAAHERLAGVTGSKELALIVKSADRLDNLINCLHSGDLKRWEMYLREHEAFLAAVYRPGLCESIWDRLDAAVSTGPESPPQ